MFEFQGHAAYEKTEMSRAGVFDDPDVSLHTIFVSRNDRWWQISLMIQQHIESLPEEFRPYLETIQFPENDLAKNKTKLDDRD